MLTLEEHKCCGRAGGRSGGQAGMQATNGLVSCGFKIRSYYFRECLCAIYKNPCFFGSVFAPNVKILIFGSVCAVNENSYATFVEINDVLYNLELYFQWLVLLNGPVEIQCLFDPLVSSDVWSEYASVKGLVSASASDNAAVISAVILSTVATSTDYSSMHPQDFEHRTMARGATYRR
jgi:hypothetical protein